MVKAAEAMIPTHAKRKTARLVHSDCLGMSNLTWLRNLDKPNLSFPEFYTLPGFSQSI